jgi:cytochrome c peroxidase
VRTKTKLLSAVVVTALALGIPFLPSPAPKAPTLPSKMRAEARLANASRLESTYQTWKAAYEKDGANHNQAIALGWSRGLSSEYTAARGLIRLDLIGGQARAEIDGLEAGQGWEVWLVDNQEGPGRSAIPERGDLMHKLGRLRVDSGRAVLTARVNPRLFNGFEVDVVAVTRAGIRPEEGTVLFGSPMLFQRLYTRETQAPAARLASAPRLSLLGPGAAFADTPFNSLDPLIAQGADLFFNETFNGNGRVCATCHPAENNFTIDPKFISTLSANDPLFVGETNPNLGSRFEKATLLREMGLVLENVDGFEDLDNKFVLRGVPHLLGLSRYLTPGNQSVPPLQRTGWGGDGAPGSGTLREFATGAVVQHFTNSLARTPGVDFRLPTDQELDALEAFQLALGRQDNPDIATLSLRGPVADRGRVLFQSVNARCTFCHINGGANGPVDPQNRNFDIGIEDLPDHPANLIAPGNLRPDGGFGTTPLYDPQTNEFIGFGTLTEEGPERRFNSQPAIEAVDTGPFFHNNAIQTLEEAVDFYNSQAFKNSLAGNLNIRLETTEVEAIAAFLRVMSALENIRASLELDHGAIEESDRHTAQRLARLASFDTEDAAEVLEQRSLHLSAVHKLKTAFRLERLAVVSNSATVRGALLSQAIELKEQARAEMIVE